MRCDAERDGSEGDGRGDGGLSGSSTQRQVVPVSGGQPAARFRPEDSFATTATAKLDTYGPRPTHLISSVSSRRCSSNAARASLHCSRSWPTQSSENAQSQCPRHHRQVTTLLDHTRGRSGGATTTKTAMITKASAQNSESTLPLAQRPRARKRRRKREESRRHCRAFRQALGYRLRRSRKRLHPRATRQEPQQVRCTLSLSLVFNCRLMESSGSIWHARDAAAPSARANAVLLPAPGQHAVAAATTVKRNPPKRSFDDDFGITTARKEAREQGKRPASVDQALRSGRCRLSPRTTCSHSCKSI